MKKNKLAYKNEGMENITIDPVIPTLATVISFMLVSKVKLCFRECSKIIKIAEETGCIIEIASGTKSGTSESILSLVNLGITVDKSLVLTIKGTKNQEALKRVSKIINGTSEE